MAASDAIAIRPSRAVREWITVRDPTLSSFRRIRYSYLSAIDAFSATIRLMVSASPRA